MAERINAKNGLVDAWTTNLGGPQNAALLEWLDKTVARCPITGRMTAFAGYRKPVP